MPNTYLTWLATRTPGRWWVDTGVLEEINQALAMGACGVTMNPLLLARGLAASAPGTREVVATGGPLRPGGPERAEEITRRVAVDAARRLLPVYDASGGSEGFVCAQVNPALAANAREMVAQAHRIDAWAPNVIVKLPATAAGLLAIERCVGDGINVVATVSFSVAQAVAVAEAHERGLADAQVRGVSGGRCYAVVMLGRLDDHLKRVAAPSLHGEIDSAAVSVARACRSILSSRGFSATLLPSGMRHTSHVTELAGGDFVFSISPEMAQRLNAEDPPHRARVEEQTPGATVERLRSIPDFVRAYDPDGMPAAEFADYGAARFTLDQFAREGWAVLEGWNPR